MKLSVLQWNVWLDENADRVLEFIKQTDADIVCLQELTRTSTANPERDLPVEIAQLGYESAYVMTVDKPGWQMGNGIFTKFPIEDQRTVWLRHEVPGVMMSSNEPRAYLECQLKIDQKLLTVGTVHLSFSPGFSFSPEKAAESKVFQTAVKANQANFIFTGDLNALPNSQLIAELDRAFKPAGPAYTEATWTTKPFEWQDFKAEKLNWRLDYVYTTPDIKVISSQILSTDISDHLPILIEVEF